MYEELRLMALGWPLEDALTFCHAMRKEGELETAMDEIEARSKLEKSYVCRV